MSRGHKRKGAAKNAELPLLLHAHLVNSDSVPAFSGDRARNGARTSALILLAEDHFDSREALRALLEAHGYEVIEAVNGREAVDRAQAEQPDLILMDIMMPEIDGFEATRMLRRSEAMNGVPIIAVTAMDGAQRLSLQAGANDFVAKPVDTRGLLAKIRGWLGQDSQDRKGGRSPN